MIKSFWLITKYMHFGNRKGNNLLAISGLQLIVERKQEFFYAFIWDKAF